eukprot:scaffold18816_cov32-Tisochrysis_lutea.AAC.9
MTIATQRKLTQMEVVMKKWSTDLAKARSGGRSISTNEVSVKPAMIADCVPTAEKFELNSLSSRSRRLIARCFTSDCSSSLSAASILEGEGAREGGERTGGGERRKRRE